MRLYDLSLRDTYLISMKAVVRRGPMVLALGRSVADEKVWELPGGLLEMRESLLEGLSREVLEETGIVVTVGRLLCAWDHWIDNFRFRDGRVLNARVLELAFDCTATTGDVVLSDEHDTYRWLDQTQLASLIWSVNSRSAIDALMARV